MEDGTGVALCPVLGKLLSVVLVIGDILCNGNGTAVGEYKGTSDIERSGDTVGNLEGRACGKDSVGIKDGLSLVFLLEV